MSKRIRVWLTPSNSPHDVDMWIGTEPPQRDEYGEWCSYNADPSVEDGDLDVAIYDSMHRDEVYGRCGVRKVTDKNAPVEFRLVRVEKGDV